MTSFWIAWLPSSARSDAAACRGTWEQRLLDVLTGPLLGETTLTPAIVVWEGVDEARCPRPVVLRDFSRCRFGASRGASLIGSEAVEIAVATAGHDVHLAAATRAVGRIPRTTVVADAVVMSELDAGRWRWRGCRRCRAAGGGRDVHVARVVAAGVIEAIGIRPAVGL